MAAPLISLTPEGLDARLSTLEGFEQELAGIMEEVSAMTFGPGGGNRSAGPCAGGSNDLGEALYDACADVSAAIGASVAHLRSIRDDIVAAQGG